jgi:hypothetical protein
MRMDKVGRKLAEVVGSRCSVTLSNGDVVSGVLKGFKYGFPLVLYIVGESRFFVNFRYVIKLAVEGV